MKEIIKVKTNGGLKTIGYTTMMAPTSLKEEGKVFKMLRLLSTGEEEGDIHVFECIRNEWYLRPDKSLINLNNNELVNLYQFLPRTLPIEFETFIDLISEAI
jgi:hypothetical protein